MIFTQKIPKVVMEEHEVEIVSIKFISPSLSLSFLKCSACGMPIGDKRPIAIAWGDDKSWRLCHDCSNHLNGLQSA